jgi:hypothetical protein
MTKVMPVVTETTLEYFFGSKRSPIKNAKRVPVDKEMIKMNARLEAARQEFRSRSAASLMAVHDFFYNA